MAFEKKSYGGGDRDRKPGGDRGDKKGGDKAGGAQEPPRRKLWSFRHQSPQV